ncbi:LysR substrate-binding domain-containing protein [Microbispora sp. GKU 823]|uniref:LysR substrate-binding domain-containing protein n=1 Tax=Microbispora sp. GKU 823 TaxID=1652100 RepID=UPI001C4E08A3|nr:LysR substrate-binding domain-containing protein [Microbispora sp. GKU 823]
MRTVAQAAEALGGVRLEPGPGRDWPSVARSLLNGDTDLGFGRVHPLPDGGDAGLTQRLVRLEPVDAVVGAAHPLAGADELRPADLRDSTLWCPAELSRLDFLRRFGDEFGITRRQDGPNLGLDHLVRRIRDDASCFTLFPADAPLPDHAGLRAIALTAPTPLYAWSLAWRESYGHPLARRPVARLRRRRASPALAEYTPGRTGSPTPTMRASRLVRRTAAVPERPRSATARAGRACGRGRPWPSGWCPRRP